MTSVKVVQRVVGEIIRQCSKKGKDISEPLAEFMLKAVLLRPTMRMPLNHSLTVEDENDLVELCCHHLLSPPEPCLDTIRMQLAFETHYDTREGLIRKHYEIVMSKVRPIARHIIKNQLQTKEDIDTMHSKIISYILLKTGTGSPAEPDVRNETMAALQSVFPRTELATFAVLPENERELHLLELAYIVTGIRLYNRQCGKGGRGLFDVPGMLKDAIPKFITKISSQIETTEEIIAKLTSLLQGGITEEYAIQDKLFDPIVLRAALANSYQRKDILQLLLDEAEHCEKRHEELEDKFELKMRESCRMADGQNVIPAIQILPIFVDLAKLWTFFQHEAILLSAYSSILTTVEFHSEHSSTIANAAFEKLVEFPTEGTATPSMSEEDSSTSSSPQQDGTDVKYRLDSNLIQGKEINILYPDSPIRNFYDLPLQYNGFCPWSIIEGSGTLLLARRELGIVLYGGACYGFSSIPAGHAFLQDPHKYIDGIVELAHTCPELILLLEIEDRFRLFDEGFLLRQYRKKPHPVVKSDSGCQTDVHPVEENIDPSYEWNEWELRRRALRLTAIENKKTHSTQTADSHFRRENSTQVYLPKDNSTQTKRETGTAMPKPTVFYGYHMGQKSELEGYTPVDLTLYSFPMTPIK